MRPNRASSPRRWLALVLAGLYVASTAVSFAHLATTQHARCPDHGELMHVEPVTHEAGLEMTAPGELPTLARGGALGDPHDHDHCAVTPLGESGWAQRVSQTSAPLLAARVDPAPLSGDVAFVTVARYLIAPKTSPPVA